MPIRCDGGCHPGAGQDPAQIVYPLTRVMIHLPNDQVRIDSASVVNMTRSDLTTHNPNPEYH